MQQFVDNEPTFTALPFTGIKDNQTPQQQDFFKAYPKTGTVLQSAVKYIDPQWMDIGSEMAGMFTGQKTAEEVLLNIDKYRARQAEAVSDSFWN